MNAPAKRLFLSAVTNEFGSYRELLAGDLRRALVEVRTQEDFGTRGESTLDKLDAYIRECQAVVHLVGDATGSVPPGPAVRSLLEKYPDFTSKVEPLKDLPQSDIDAITYTQWEAYLAIYHPCRLHIYRAKDSAPRNADFRADDQQRRQQQAHFNRIEHQGCDRDVFLNQERLSSFVLADLNDILPPRDSDVVVAPSRLRHAAARLVGRESALAQLDEAWNDPNRRVLVIRAWGGVGKTALVAAWMAEMELKDWRGARRVFDWSFYSQGTRTDHDADKAVSADQFIAAALRFFGDPDPQAGSPWDRGARLATLVARSKSLLVLDGVEPLQHPPGPLAGQLTDPALTSLLKGLASQNPGLCIVTTREHVVDLEGRRTVEEWPLEHLSDQAGAELLHSLGVTHAGTGDISPDAAVLREATREVDGHALTLSLMGRYLALALDGDVRQRDVFRFSEADSQWKTNPQDADKPYGHAFKVIRAYEQWLPKSGPDGQRELAILRLLGLFNRPADAGCLAALREQPPIPGLTDALVGIDDREWTIAVKRLETIGLVKRDPPTGTKFSLDAHPLVREYFAHQLRTPAASGSSAPKGRNSIAQTSELVCQG